MLALGDLALKESLRGLWFLGYWGTCFLFVMLAMLTAWFDLRALKRQGRDAQRDLMEQAMEDYGRTAAGSGSRPPTQARSEKPQSAGQS